MMNWTTERPTEPGYYVFKHAACWPLYFVRVDVGKWQLSQNPSQGQRAARCSFKSKSENERFK